MYSQYIFSLYKKLQHKLDSSLSYTFPPRPCEVWWLNEGWMTACGSSLGCINWSCKHFSSPRGCDRRPQILISLSLFLCLSLLYLFLSLKVFIYPSLDFVPQRRWMHLPIGGETGSGEGPFYWSAKRKKKKGWEKNGE